MLHRIDPPPPLYVSGLCGRCLSPTSLSPYLDFGRWKPGPGISLVLLATVVDYSNHGLCSILLVYGMRNVCIGNEGIDFLC